MANSEMLQAEWVEQEPKSKQQTRIKARKLLRLLEKTPPHTKGTEGFVKSVHDNIKSLEVYIRKTVEETGKVPRTSVIFRMLRRYVAFEHEVLVNQGTTKLFNPFEVQERLFKFVDVYFRKSNAEVKACVFLLHIITSAYQFYELPHWFWQIFAQEVATKLRTIRGVGDTGRGKRVSIGDLWFNDDLGDLVHDEEYGTDYEDFYDDNNTVEDPKIANNEMFPGVSNPKIVSLINNRQEMKIKEKVKKKQSEPHNPTRADNNKNKITNPPNNTQLKGINESQMVPVKIEISDDDDDSKDSFVKIEISDDNEMEYERICDFISKLDKSRREKGPKLNRPNRKSGVGSNFKNKLASVNQKCSNCDEVIDLEMCQNKTSTLFNCRKDCASPTSSSSDLISIDEDITLINKNTSKILPDSSTRVFPIGCIKRHTTHKNSGGTTRATGEDFVSKNCSPSNCEVPTNNTCINPSNCLVLEDTICRFSSKNALPITSLKQNFSAPSRHINFSNSLLCGEAIHRAYSFGEKATIVPHRPISSTPSIHTTSSCQTTVTCHRIFSLALIRTEGRDVHHPKNSDGTKEYSNCHIFKGKSFFQIAETYKPPINDVSSSQETFISLSPVQREEETKTLPDKEEGNTSLFREIENTNSQKNIMDEQQIFDDLDSNRRYFSNRPTKGIAQDSIINCIVTKSYITDGKVNRKSKYVYLVEPKGKTYLLTETIDEKIRPKVNLKSENVFSNLNWIERLILAEKNSPICGADNLTRNCQSYEIKLNRIESAAKISNVELKMTKCSLIECLSWRSRVISILEKNNIIDYGNLHIRRILQVSSGVEFTKSDTLPIYNCEIINVAAKGADCNFPAGTLKSRPLTEIDENDSLNNNQINSLHALQSHCTSQTSIEEIDARQNNDRLNPSHILKQDAHCTSQITIDSWSTNSAPEYLEKTAPDISSTDDDDLIRQLSEAFSSPANINVTGKGNFEFTLHSNKQTSNQKVVEEEIVSEEDKSTDDLNLQRIYENQVCNEEQQLCNEEEVYTIEEQVCNEEIQVCDEKQQDCNEQQVYNKEEHVCNEESSPLIYLWLSGNKEEQLPGQVSNMKGIIPHKEFVNDEDIINNEEIFLEHQIQVSVIPEDRATVQIQKYTSKDQTTDQLQSLIKGRFMKYLGLEMCKQGHIAINKSPIDCYKSGTTLKTRKPVSKKRTGIYTKRFQNLKKKLAIAEKLRGEMKRWKRKGLNRNDGDTKKNMKDEEVCAAMQLSSSEKKSPLIESKHTGDQINRTDLKNGSNSRKESNSYDSKRVKIKKDIHNVKPVPKHKDLNTIINELIESKLISENARICNNSKISESIRDKAGQPGISNGTLKPPKSRIEVASREMCPSDYSIGNKNKVPEHQRRMLKESDAKLSMAFDNNSTISTNHWGNESENSNVKRSEALNEYENRNSTDSFAIFGKGTKVIAEHNTVTPFPKRFSALKPRSEKFSTRKEIIAAATVLELSLPTHSREPIKPSGTPVSGENGGAPEEGNFTNLDANNGPDEEGKSYRICVLQDSTIKCKLTAKKNHHLQANVQCREHSNQTQPSVHFSGTEEACEGKSVDNLSAMLVVETEPAEFDISSNSCFREAEEKKRQHQNVEKDIEISPEKVSVINQESTGDQNKGEPYLSDDRNVADKVNDVKIKGETVNNSAEFKILIKRLNNNNYIQILPRQGLGNLKEPQSRKECSGVKESSKSRTAESTYEGEKWISQGRQVKAEKKSKTRVYKCFKRKYMWANERQKMKRKKIHNDPIPGTSSTKLCKLFVQQRCDDSWEIKDLRERNKNNGEGTWGIHCSSAGKNRPPRSVGEYASTNNHDLSFANTDDDSEAPKSRKHHSRELRNLDNANCTPVKLLFEMDKCPSECTRSKSNERLMKLQIEAEGNNCNQLKKGFLFCRISGEEDSIRRECAATDGEERNKSKCHPIERHFVKKDESCIFQSGSIHENRKIEHHLETSKGTEVIIYSNGGNKNEVNDLSCSNKFTSDEDVKKSKRTERIGSEDDCCEISNGNPNSNLFTFSQVIPEEEHDKIKASASLSVSPHVDSNSGDTKNKKNEGGHKTIKRSNLNNEAGKLVNYSEIREGMPQNMGEGHDTHQINEEKLKKIDRVLNFEKILVRNQNIEKKRLQINSHREKRSEVNEIYKLRNNEGDKADKICKNLQHTQDVAEDVVKDQKLMGTNLAIKLLKLQAITICDNIKDRNQETSADFGKGNTLQEAKIQVRQKARDANEKDTRNIAEYLKQQKPLANEKKEENKNNASKKLNEENKKKFLARLKLSEITQVAQEARDEMKDTNNRIQKKVKRKYLEGRNTKKISNYLQSPKKQNRTDARNKVKRTPVKTFQNQQKLTEINMFQELESWKEQEEIDHIKLHKTKDGSCFQELRVNKPPMRVKGELKVKKTSKHKLPEDVENIDAGNSLVKANSKNQLTKSEHTEKLHSEKWHARFSFSTESINYIDITTSSPAMIEGKTRIETKSTNKRKFERFEETVRLKPLKERAANAEGNKAYEKTCGSSYLSKDRPKNADQELKCEERSDIKTQSANFFNQQNNCRGEIKLNINEKHSLYDTERKVEEREKKSKNDDKKHGSHDAKYRKVEAQKHFTFQSQKREVKTFTKSNFQEEAKTLGKKRALFTQEIDETCKTPKITKTRGFNQTKSKRPQSVKHLDETAQDGAKQKRKNSRNFAIANQNNFSNFKSNAWTGIDNQGSTRKDNPVASLPKTLSTQFNPIIKRYISSPGLFLVKKSSPVTLTEREESSKIANNENLSGHNESDYKFGTAHQKRSNFINRDSDSVVIDSTNDSNNAYQKIGNTKANDSASQKLYSEYQQRGCNKLRTKKRRASPKVKRLKNSEMGKTVQSRKNSFKNATKFNQQNTVKSNYVAAKAQRFASPNVIVEKIPFYHYDVEQPDRPTEEATDSTDVLPLTEARTAEGIQAFVNSRGPEILQAQGLGVLGTTDSRQLFTRDMTIYLKVPENGALDYKSGKEDLNGSTKPHRIITGSSGQRGVQLLSEEVSLKELGTSTKDEHVYLKHMMKVQKGCQGITEYQISNNNCPDYSSSHNICQTVELEECLCQEPEMLSNDNDLFEKLTEHSFINDDKTGTTGDKAPVVIDSKVYVKLSDSAIHTRELIQEIFENIFLNTFENMSENQSKILNPNLEICLNDAWKNEPPKEAPKETAKFRLKTKNGNRSATATEETTCHQEYPEKQIMAIIKETNPKNLKISNADENVYQEKDAANNETTTLRNVTNNTLWTASDVTNGKTVDDGKDMLTLSWSHKSIIGNKVCNWASEACNQVKPSEQTLIVNENVTCVLKNLIPSNFDKSLEVDYIVGENVPGLPQVLRKQSSSPDSNKESNTDPDGNPKFVNDRSPMLRRFLKLTGGLKNIRPRIYNFDASETHKKKPKFVTIIGSKRESWRKVDGDYFGTG